MFSSTLYISSLPRRRQELVQKTNIRFSRYESTFLWRIRKDLLKDQMHAESVLSWVRKPECYIKFVHSAFVAFFDKIIGYEGDIIICKFLI